jgi:cell division control protein 6
MSNIIKTLIPLTEEYVPPKIIDRDVEKLEIKNFLEPISQGQQLYNLLITGSVGVGKTVLTKVACSNLPTNSVYVRLTENDNTFPKFLNKIIAIMGLPFPITPYLPSNIALMKFEHHVDETSKRRNASFLMVFDDFDKVPITAVQPFLHSVPRSTSWCNFLIISRNPAVLETLPSDTKSTLRCRELPLKPYNKETLIMILRQRVELALHEGVLSDDLIDKIANEASFSGSAREAVEILKTTCLIAARQGADKVEAVHFEEAMEEIERRSLEDTINDLPINHKLILTCCRQYPRTYEEIYNEWLFKLKSRKLKELSIYRFRDLVADLKKLDLLRPEIKGHGRGRGFSYYLKLSPHVDPKMLEKVKQNAG